MRRNLAIVAFAFASVAGAEPSLNDNLDAQVIMAHYDKAVADAKKAYDIAVAKAATTAVKELQHVQADETKMGRLEVAMAVKKKIEELQELTNPSTGGVGRRENETAILGKWSFYDSDNGVTSVIEFRDDGYTYASWFSWAQWYRWSVTGGVLRIYNPTKPDHGWSFPLPITDVMIGKMEGKNGVRKITRIK